MTTWLAITRADVADYINTLMFVYLILIFIRILIELDPADALQPLPRRLPEVRERRDDPYLNLFRRILPHGAPRARCRTRPEPDRGHVRADHRRQHRGAA